MYGTRRQAARWSLAAKELGEARCAISCKRARLLGPGLLPSWAINVILRTLSTRGAHIFRKIYANADEAPETYDEKTFTRVWILSSALLWKHVEIFLSGFPRVMRNRPSLVRMFAFRFEAAVRVTSVRQPRRTVWTEHQTLLMRGQSEAPDAHLVRRSSWVEQGMKTHTKNLGRHWNNE